MVQVKKGMFAHRHTYTCLAALPSHIRDAHYMLCVLCIGVPSMPIIVPRTPLCENTVREKHTA